jgi:hypothetical protein
LTTTTVEFRVLLAPVDEFDDPSPPTDRREVVADAVDELRRQLLGHVSRGLTVVGYGPASLAVFRTPGDE